MSANDLVRAAEKATGNPLTLEKNLVILGYEVGEIGRNYIYSSWQKDDEAKAALRSNMLLELSDVITQARTLHFLLFKELRDHKVYRPAWDQLVEDGESRMLERMRQIKEGLIG